MKEVIREESESRSSGGSADLLAERTVDRVFAWSRDSLVARVTSEIQQGPSAYSMVGADYDDEAIVDLSAEDLVACFEEFFKCAEPDDAAGSTFYIPARRGARRSDRGGGLSGRSRGPDLGRDRSFNRGVEGRDDERQRR